MSSLDRSDHLSNFAADSAYLSRRPVRRDQVPPPRSFEETYPKHEFAELVRLGLALGSWLARRRRMITVKPEVPPVVPPGPLAAAD